MKKLIALTIAVFSMGSGLHAQTNYYSLVTNLWFQGSHTSVVQLAQQRLQTNTNDVAALITMSGYYLCYSDHEAYSNVASHALSSASNITTSAFQSNLDFLTFSFTESLDFMTVYHPTEEERSENIQKANRPGLFFIYEEPLRLLDEDGYFANDPPTSEPPVPNAPEGN